MMGGEGLAQASRVAILNANYIAKCLAGAYDVLYSGVKGRVAHECIIDTRPLLEEAGVTVDDIAKRLIDCGFHPPFLKVLLQPANPVTAVVRKRNARHELFSVSKWTRGACLRSTSLCGNRLHNS